MHRRFTDGGRTDRQDTGPFVSGKAYEIVTLEPGGQWQNDTVGSPNRFATEREALAAIEVLKTLGDDFASANYGVRQIDNR